jgi:hypothetical protein
MIDDECGAVDEMRVGRGKQKYSEKTCPSATFFHDKSHMT